MDSYSLKSKDRMAALEEFNIYCNANNEYIQKIRALNGIKFAAKSLASSEAGIVLRALSLSGILVNDNPKSCDDFIDNGGLNYLIEYLNSSNDSFRVESMNILKHLSG